MQAFEREGRACTVADEALDVRPVVGLDAHGGVDGEPARALPDEHAGGVGLVEEVVATEVAKDSSREASLQLTDLIGRHIAGLVKADFAAAGLAEHAVEDDEVVVRVDVERRAEAMKEADGSELCFGRRSWTRAAQRGVNRAQEDLEHAAGDAHVVVEVRTQALRNGDHPLASRHVR